MIKCNICKRDVSEEEAKKVRERYSMIGEDAVVCETCINKLVNEQIPNECVLLKECEMLIDRDRYALCRSANWIHCENATEQAKKYYKRPIEWLIIQFYQKMPEDFLLGKAEEKKKEPEKTEKKRRFFH